MNKKMGAGVSVVIAIITVVGVGSYSFNIDQSTTNIGQIGDINNFIQNNLGIDLNEFKRLCDAGTVHEEFKQYCRLI